MSRTALVVDDFRTNRMVVAFTLQGDGFEVVEAADGLEGLARLDGRSIDLIIVDIIMPHIDGYRMIEELRQRPRYRSTPVLVLTSEEGKDAKRHARNVGASGWIVKPFNPEKLLEAVHQIVF